MDKHTVLVTGGAGFIGSHACIELLQAGYQVVVVDNLSNSKVESLSRVQQITGKTLQFYEADIRDKSALTEIFAEESINTVIHFAGLKAVGESCQQPLNYYHNNVYGTLVLLDVMVAANVKQLVFSSSATVYEPSTTNAQYSEDLPLGAINPYGRSKVMIEDILRDLSAVDKLGSTNTPWKIALLRYFNPIGAHESGLIGEDPNGIPNNLMPYVTQVAIGKLKQLSVFGNDYPTPDGTGIRDYIHVVDLVKGHIKAIETIESAAFNNGGCHAYNLGTGKGYSVLDIVNAFEKMTGKTLPYQFSPRRAGDLAECFANPERAAKELNWTAEKNLDDMVADTWKWQVQNPQGYAS
ncbi:UDP-glucose 4-epimerase GalE [Crenothrix polyspora]|uniref:UDP-glucose 4-epimerase n=1 Tax=Crenothrix polyspora TaxID=360316 RepID=A0A1R4H5K3_9GAMM|nr:UDP-glucose 4-epimerase GalE [Crenothrix polyspora]SJM91545.1 UDP-galactose-4-epimerase [Crenothrix polyspora]